MIVASAARTDVGRVRTRNEDNLANLADLNLYVVADGMGGHQGGDEASRHACEVIAEHIRGKWFLVEGFQREPVPSRRRQVMQLLTEAVRACNDRIVLASEQSPELQGMGSTVVVLLLVADRAFVAHVGDSRAYLVRDQSTVLLTEDHSLLFELLRQGRLTRGQAARFPMKNVVTRALGVRGPVDADVMDLPVLQGDRFLLCTDGLHGYVEDERIPRLVGEGGLQAVVDRLVAFANAGGGSDNITALVAEIQALSGDSIEARKSFQHLRAAPLLQDLSTAEILRLVSAADHRRYQPGDRVVREGERLDGMHLVLSGMVEVQRGQLGTIRIGEGSSFGDMALLEDRPPEASVVAIEPSELAVVPRRAFEALCATSPQLGVRLLRQMARSLARRLRTANDETALLRAVLERESVVTPLFRTVEALSDPAIPQMADDEPTPKEGVRLPPLEVPNDPKE